MAVNRGKQFEQQIYDAFCRINNFTIDRLPDPMAGYAGVRNICDYFGYYYPNAYYIECKSCHGNTFPLSNITDNQWNGLLTKAKVTGVVAGYIIWFIDHDRTVFIDAITLGNYLTSGHKSVNVKALDSIRHTDIHGKKKRILFEYDLTDFVKGDKL